MDTQAPDERGAEALVLEHLADIVTLCNRMFRRVTDAQDATHEAVVEILRSLPSYRGEGPVRHWLLKVALNAARRHRRRLTRRARRETTLTIQELSEAVTKNPTVGHEEREALRSAIAELPGRLREPVILHYFHHLTQVQIAGCLNCSQKTVHVRIRKGLARLSQRMRGSRALGALVGPGGAVAPVLDAVPAALVASVKQSIAGHAAAAAGAAGGGAAGPIATGHMFATTAVATGGTLMNVKLLAGAAALAASFLLGGVALSDHVLGSGRGGAHAARVADIERRLEAERRNMLALQDALRDTERREAAGLAGLRGELASMQRRVREKDHEIGALRARLPEASEGERDPSAEASRLERWEEIQATLARVMDVMGKINEEGANLFALGPQLVAELGKLSAEDFEKILAFDAEETDAQIVGDISAVVMQALIFVPNVVPQRDAYMERYLARVLDARYDGATFTELGLRAISYSWPPWVDAYAKIVVPMDEGLRQRFLELALDRAARGASESLRLDGVAFLARSDDPRATAELMQVFGWTANAQPLRLAALQGLSSRADEGVLRFLQGAAATEQDPTVRAQVEDAALRIAERLAEGR